MGQDGSINILVAEDDSGLGELFGLALRRHKYNVDIANNGTEALDLARSKTYDVILTDTEMPDMKGYELSDKLRASGYNGAIIGMSANPDYKNRYTQFIFKGDINFFSGYLPQRINEAMNKAA